MADLLSNLALEIIFLIIGTIFSTYLSLTIKRSKIITGGFGSSNIRCTLGIRNDIGRFGITIPVNRIFGYIINNEKFIGRTFERNVAKNCRATLLDQYRNPIGSFCWVNQENKYVYTVDIKSNETYNLALFSSIDQKYMIDKSASDPNPVDVTEYIRGEKTLYLQLTWEYAAEKIFRLEVRRVPSGYEILINGNGPLIV